ncbi:hypothetical protein Q3G72_034547 [Acer saccharum]|nr:hypothetical protein Q3G72_034547 [Acer saccharum]
MMKFPTEYGVGVVKGSQEMARRANLSVYKDREVHQVYIVSADQTTNESDEDVFAWSHEDMLGIDTKVISHYLSINLEFHQVVQKRRLFNPERSTAVKKEVEKLLSAGSIREVKYPEWVANVALVKKKNNQ